ncbi:hypothetical protein CRG98_050115 [Punica granatum]|uniref:Uncharacterized protein n=1 Tax=Punica granatum TaxID=22663 RepID=A0A2I0GT33_PUNGR|nr:hypothetical protein CRG98_050115 [Punica granatum]
MSSRKGQRQGCSNRGSGSGYMPTSTQWLREVEGGTSKKLQLHSHHRGRTLGAREVEEQQHKTAQELVGQHTATPGASGSCESRLQGMGWRHWCEHLAEPKRSKEEECWRR